MSLRMRSAVSFDLKALKAVFFLLSASFKNFLSLFSCPVTARSDLKVFHIASSILKAISHALTGPIFSRSIPSNAVFYSPTELTKQSFHLVVQPTKINKKIEKMEESLKACSLTKKKKHLRISPTHNEYAAYNASGCLDTCKRRKRFDPTRVNAPKISGSLTSGTSIRISRY